MSTVPTPGISVEISLLTPLLLMLTSVVGARLQGDGGLADTRRAHQRPPRRRRCGARAAGASNEPDVPAAPRPIPDRGRSAWGGAPLSSPPGAKVKDVLGHPRVVRRERPGPRGGTTG